VSLQHGPARWAVLICALGCTFLATCALALWVLWILLWGTSPAAFSARAPAIDVGLLVLFGLQHSGMARPACRAFTSHVVTETLEPSAYALVSGIVLLMFPAFWVDFGPVLWNAEAAAARYAILALSVAGFGLAGAAVISLDPSEVVGVRQAVSAFRGTEFRPTPFRTRGLHRYVRHPAFLGMIIGVWAAPTLTAGRLLLAAGLTVYMLAGAALEERNLTARYGEEYERYRKSTPMLIPWPTVRR
jgi:protein-S-isoprenylcysteine O-methyltransferase Ste14